MRLPCLSLRWMVHQQLLLHMFVPPRAAHAEPTSAEDRRHSLVPALPRPPKTKVGGPRRLPLTARGSACTEEAKGSHLRYAPGAEAKG